MYWLLALLIPLPATDAPVVVVTMTGERLTGALERMADEQLVLRRDEDAVTLDWSEIETLSIVNASTVDSASPFRVRLADGSVVRAEDVTLTEGMLWIMRSAAFEVSGRRTEWIQMVPMDDVNDRQTREIAEQWLALLEEPIDADTVIVRRNRETEPNRVELAAYPGVIQAIDEETVTFEFNDSIVPVNRDRVIGVRFFRPADRSLPDEICRVDCVDGSTLMARRMDVDTGELTVTTTAGLTMSIPLSEVASFDFSSGRVAYLSALDPSTVEWTPFVSSAHSGSLLEQWNSFRINQSFEGEPLELFDADGFADEVTERIGLRPPTTRSFADGLAIRSQSRLIYRLGGAYSQMTALAGIAPGSRPRGSVDLVIRGDGRVLWEQRITGVDRKPWPIDLDIRGVQRLSIEVGFGEQLDIADHLHLCGAKVIK